jgi:hypothetical protein
MRMQSSTSRELVWIALVILIVGCEAPTSTMVNPGVPPIRIEQWQTPPAGARFAFRGETIDSLNIHRDTNNNIISRLWYDTLTFEKVGLYRSKDSMEVLTRWTNGYKFYEYVSRDSAGDFRMADSGVGGWFSTRYPGLNPYTEIPNAPFDTAFSYLPEVIYGPPATIFIFQRARYWCVGTDYFILAGKSMPAVVVRDSIIRFDTLESGKAPDTLISCHTLWFVPSLGCFVRYREDYLETNKGVAGTRNYYQRELEAYKPKD